MQRRSRWSGKASQGLNVYRLHRGGIPGPVEVPTRCGRFLLMLAGMAACLAVLPAAAAAATYNVNTTADLSDPNGCQTLPECSLREAVNAASAGGGGEIITLPKGHYSLDPPNGSLFIDEPNTTITGAGAPTTLIDGAGATRVFVIDSGIFVSNPAALNLSDLTVTGGVA